MVELGHLSFIIDSGVMLGKECRWAVKAGRGSEREKQAVSGMREREGHVRAMPAKGKDSRIEFNSIY